MSGGELIGQDAHKGGFAGAVCSDNTVAVAGSELHIYILKQNALAELYAEIVYRYHKMCEKIVIFAGAKVQKTFLI